MARRADQQRETGERFDGLANDLGPLAADGRHATTICEDRPRWAVICQSCGDHTPEVTNELVLGRDYQTMAEAEAAAAARRVAKAGAFRDM